MDQLHLDLWWRGLNIAQDAGTYLYNADFPWDNALIATRVHNTVTMDGANQMTRAGRFLVVDWFNAYTKNIVSLDENTLSCVEAHYREVHPFKHERTVTAYRDERWIVQDVMTVYNRRKKLFRLHWLLPDYEWQITGEGFRTEIRLHSPRGGISLAVHAASRIRPSSFDFEPLQVSLVRAGTVIYGEREDMQPYEGWVSRTYAHKSPALSFAVDVTSARDIEFTSEFLFGG